MQGNPKCTREEIREEREQQTPKHGREARVVRHERTQGTRKAKAQMRSGNAASSLEQRRLDRQRRLDIQNAAVAASSRAAYVREVSAPKNSTLYEERQKKSSRANLLTEPRNSTNSGSANTKGNQKSTKI